MRKWRTRGNFPIGNLWLAGRSHTYLLWWIMGSPQDSCLTCQVSVRGTVSDAVFPSITHKPVLNENTFSPVQRGNICRSRDAARLCQNFPTQVYILCMPFSSATDLCIFMLWNWSKEVSPAVYGSLNYDRICFLLPPCVLEENDSYQRFKCMAHLTIKDVACHVHGFHLIKCSNHLFKSALHHYHHSQSLRYYINVRCGFCL